MNDIADLRAVIEEVVMNVSQYELYNARRLELLMQGDGGHIKPCN